MVQKNFRKEAAKKHGSNGPDGSMPACRCMGRNYACWKNKVSISRKRICEPGNFKMCLEAAYAGIYVYRVVIAVKPKIVYIVKYLAHMAGGGKKIIFHINVIKPVKGF